VSRSSSAAYLLARARTPEPPELAEMAWLQALLPNERERALADLKVVQVEVGELLCRVGRPVTYWFGVVDGLLKMSNDTAMGVPVTFTGIAPGGWFGEGTVIKREAYRYNIQALRKSVVAGLSVDTFHWLLDRSIPLTASSSSSSTSGSASSSPRARSTGSATPTRAWRAASPRCSIRSSIRASARCCASPSRSSATW